MLENPVAVMAAYTAGSMFLSVTMARFSPTIGTKLRTFFAGFGPMVVVYGSEIARENSVVLHGADLLLAGAMLALGTGAAFLAGGVVKKPRKSALLR
ncbi:hypothetical protein FHS61_001812 [Altererythrobacter atlanticus]|uniref:Uncharacterized protein n=1 Tax=Croceibacterium atlanticum TaxID=1267766 RepID=A0A0F7KR45_9SPHN|nr:hypothetical protein [Croceibacterium atlanticum]AKH41285.1 hypothetical protein WYH_00221 [Croceibacterium atlanticum]MBB5732803.1 hypothetical protein [Croceibacterium atlanticum]